MTIESIFKKYYLSINKNLSLLLLTTFLSLGNLLFKNLFVSALSILATVLGLLTIIYFSNLCKLGDKKVVKHKYDYNCSCVSIDPSIPHPKIIVGEIQLSFLFLLLTASIASIAGESIPTHISISTVGLITFLQLIIKTKQAIIKFPPNNPTLDNLAKDLDDDNFWENL
jgi:uncharacterized membrane protein YbhN (UPF0104 family)